MKRVKWVDDSGYKRVSIIGDGEDDSAAPEGIRLDPPDINELDWEGIKMDIHNRLVDAGLFNWRDIQREQNALTGMVRSVIVRRIVALYRNHETLEST